MKKYKGISIPLALLLGGTAQTSAAQRDAEDIIRANKTYWHGEMGDLDKLRDEIYGMAVNHAGDLTNLWAMLLWINQPSHVTFTAIPATRRISGGKLRAYAAHHVVDINIGRHRSIRRAYIATGPRRPPRRHDVRGHWAHHGGQVEGCTHSWPLIPDVDGHYRCSSCGRLRYWIHEHQRGRADIGFVTKEYAVHEGSLNESRPGQHPPPDAVSPTTSRPGALE